MKKIFCINNSTENKISYCHLLFFLMSLPFDRFYSTIILISFLIHSVIFLRKKQLLKINSRTIIPASVFFVTVICSTYAVSFTGGMYIAEKQLAILIFPILLSISPLDIRKYRTKLLQGLAYCCTVTVAYLYFDAFHIIIYNGLSPKKLFSWAFVNHNFSLPIEMHATYLSMLLLMSLVFFLQQLFMKPAKIKRNCYIFCSTLLTAGLIQLSSKSALIALVIIIIIAFPLFVVKKENRRIFLLFSSCISAILVLFILNVQVFRDRYVITLRDDLYVNKGIVKFNGRVDRWNTAIDLIKRSPLFGTGSGSEIPMLTDSYYESKMYGSYLNSLNAHNQYLSFLINSGVFGLIVYLATLGWGLWQAIKVRDIFLLSFLIIVMVVSFSEDILDVNKGIFFYAFFFPFLVYSGRKSVS